MALGRDSAAAASSSTPGTVSLASPADRPAWDAFVDRMPAAQAYHSFDWKGVFERATGRRCHYLLASDPHRGVTGVLPLVQLKSRLFGNFLVSVPWFNYAGVLAESEFAVAALLDAAAELRTELKASHVELRQRADAAFDLPCRTDKVSMVLPLALSEEEQWAKFSSKLRAQIRRPTKEGATACEGGIELIDEFYAVFSRNMRDLGTPVFDKRLFFETLDTFPDNANLFVVRLDGVPVAAALTIGFRERLEIPFASSLREFNRYSVNMLLYWRVLQFAISSGYRSFDFGRSTIDSGPYRFKKQWGAEADTLHWYYSLGADAEMPNLRPDNPKFQAAVRLWRKLPLPVANWLGPRLVRNLP